MNPRVFMYMNIWILERNEGKKGFPIRSSRFWLHNGPLTGLEAKGGFALFFTLLDTLVHMYFY